MAQVRQLAEDDPFAFESFAVELCHPGFKANVHQRKDGGIDGKGVLLHPIIDEDGETKNLIIVQCKAGKPNIEQVLAFDNRIKRTPRVIAGVFILWKAPRRGIGRRRCGRLRVKRANSKRQAQRGSFLDCSIGIVRRRICGTGRKPCLKACRACLI